jgi:preprotein translocase subunit SecA
MYINQQRLILEILTGEGKSVIIACIAAIFAIRGLNVDIITTSEVLAIRDS